MEEEFKIGDIVKDKIGLIGKIVVIKNKGKNILVKFNNWQKGHSGYDTEYTIEMGFDINNRSHWWVDSNEITLENFTQTINSQYSPYPEFDILIKESIKLSGI